MSRRKQNVISRAVKGRGVENSHYRVTLDCSATTLSIIAFDVCFIKTSGSVSGVVADEGATCLALVDVDTGYLRPIFASAKTASGRRSSEQFLRWRVCLRCDGELATVALAGQFKELLPCLVVLERTPWHDSLANPAKLAIRTLEEEVKLMRGDFEMAVGRLLSVAVADASRGLGGLANQSEKTNGATPHQDACDSACTSELLPTGALILFRIPLPHTMRTNQNRE